MIYWIKFETYSGPEDDLRLTTEQKITERDGVIPPERPTRTGWCLRDEYHDWFVANGISYYIRWAMEGREDRWWRIGVENVEDAIKVQLQWAKG